MKRCDTIVVMPNVDRIRKQYLWTSMSVESMVYGKFIIVEMDDSFVTVEYNNKLIVLPYECVMTVNEFRLKKLEEILS